MAKSKKHNLGKFYLHARYVEQNYDQVAEVLSHIKFTPLRVECLMYNNQYEYIGISPRFKKIPIFEDPPIYEVVTKTEDGKVDNVEVEPK